MSRILKDLLSQPKRVLRVFSLGRLCHPVAIEMFAQSGGYDGFWLDQEHSGLSSEQVLTAAIAGRAHGLGSFVRMPFTHYSLASQNLESGVEGVMAARIQSKNEAEEFVLWCKFAPRGRRGMNTQGADGWYSRRGGGELAEIANRDTFVAIQIETRGALEDADAIAAIDGVDLLFVGPADLSQELGVLGQPDHALVWDAIDRVAAACRKHGKNWGIVPFSPAYAARAVERGCRMVTYGSECHALRLGLDELRLAYGI